MPAEITFTEYERDDPKEAQHWFDIAIDLGYYGQRNKIEYKIYRCDFGRFVIIIITILWD